MQYKTSLQLIMKTIFYILFFLKFLISGLLPAQIIVNGTVIDKKTKMPIAHSTVYLPDKNIGTVANEKGNFSIYIADTIKSPMIKFSCLGYESKAEYIWKIIKSNVIELQPAEILLSEINIVAYSEKTLENILSQIIRKYRNNNTTLESKIFCAVESTDIGNDIPLEVVEAFYAGKVSLSSEWYRRNESEKWKNCNKYHICRTISESEYYYFNKQIRCI